MDSKWKVGLSAGLVIVLLVAVFGLALPVVPEEAVERGYMTGVYHTDGGDKLVAQSGGEIEVQSGATLDVQSGASVTIPGGYLLAYATTGYELVCGTSGTFTETTTIAVTGLTAISYAIATQITDPASTGAILTVDAPTTSTLTINSWETDATVGTTGVNAYYCAVGTQ